MLVARRVHAVHEIVVGRNGEGTQAAGQQLHAQPFAEGGFAARRRAGYQDQLQFGPRSNTVGHAGYLLLLKGLAHVDELVGISFLAHLVELADGGHAQNLVPPVLLAEHFKHFGLLPHGPEQVRILRVRQAEQQPVAVGHEVEEVELRRFDEQRAIEIVGRIVERIVSGIERSQPFQQLGLALQSVGAEAGHRLVRGTGDTVEGEVERHQLIHACFQPSGHVGHVGTGCFEPAAISVGHRCVNAQPGLLAQHVAHGLVKHEEERARVGAQS